MKPLPKRTCYIALIDCDAECFNQTSADDLLQLLSDLKEATVGRGSTEIYGVQEKDIDRFQRIRMLLKTTSQAL